MKRDEMKKSEKHRVWFRFNLILHYAFHQNNVILLQMKRDEMKNIGFGLGFTLILHYGFHQNNYILLQFIAARLVSRLQIGLSS